MHFVWDYYYYFIHSVVWFGLVYAGESKAGNDTRKASSLSVGINKLLSERETIAIRHSSLQPHILMTAHPAIPSEKSSKLDKDQLNNEKFNKDISKKAIILNTFKTRHVNGR